MKNRYFFIIVFLLCCGAVNAQFSAYVVQFKDKNGTGFSIAAPSAYLSPKALERRAKYKIPVDSLDLPVPKAYIDSILLAGQVVLHNTSKWFNEICIKTTDEVALEKIRRFSFVKGLFPVAGTQSTSIVARQNKPFNEPITAANHRVANLTGTTDISYGSTNNQIYIHQGQSLHEKGHKGEGMLIAVLDAGFYHYKTNPAFDSMRLQNRVVAEWDFVDNEQSVNEDHSHGMYCLSTIASNIPGTLVGSAPKASFLLLRTEDVFSEMPIEEQNWAVAAEYADSAGADMISSSLGYVNFDNPAFNHTYAERDGKTSIITRAANMAAKKGILVMSSAGNDGQKTTDEKFVACPADSDSVLAVGAVDINGNMAAFSSWGPNGAGKIKPDVVSVGHNTVVASETGTPAFLSGTSLSNPNLAGLVACLWQAYPAFTNMEIIEAIKRSAHKFTNPDERFGYGIPDFQKAYTSLEAIQANRDAARILGGAEIKAYPVPFVNELNLLIKPVATGKASIRLLDITGRILQRKTIEVIQENYSTITFQHLNTYSKGLYIIQYFNGGDFITLRLIK